MLVALYRPGPMANIPTYCARKLGHERTDYLHPKLEPILQATYGIITYQEQVQQIARDLAGYSLGKADILRRAMGKKDRKEMASQRDSFISGAVERGIGLSDAEAIFDTCAKFAEYGFQQVALGALCAAHLSDRLYEGELSGRVSRRLDDARHGQYRQTRGISRRGRADRYQGRAAIDQPFGGGIRSRRQYDLLCARGFARRWPPSGRERCCGARRHPVQGPCRFRPSHESARRQQARAGKPRRCRRFRHDRAQSRPRLCRLRYASCHRATHA